MRFYQQLASFLALLIFCSISLAQEAQDLPEMLTSIHSLQGDFVQTILDGKGKAIQRSQGKMALQRPGQFRWQVRAPIPQLIIANNSRLWIYDPDLQQVVIRSVVASAGQTPAFLLSNASTNVSRDYVVRSMPASQNWQWFSLTPKAKDSMFNVIQLGFYNHEIKEMRMQDNLGHSTVIQFQHLRKNEALAASLFKFQAPANVDVIDETRSR